MPIYQTLLSTNEKKYIQAIYEAMSFVMKQVNRCSGISLIGHIL